MIPDVPNSCVALAITQIASEKNKVFVDSGPAPLTSPARSATPNNVHWTYDTWMLANGTGGAVVKHGGDTLVLPDRRLRLRPCARARHGGGGQEAKAARSSARSAPASRHQDFSSFLLQAQASKAKVIGLANAGGDTINSIKQACRVRHRQGRAKLAGLLIFATDIRRSACRPRRV